MWIYLVLIGIISLIVIAGTAYLFITKNQELVEHKKVTILVVLGAVIFVSFLVTTYKHNGFSFTSDDLNQRQLDQEKVFFGSKCKFSYKPKYGYAVDVPRQYEEQIFDRNYRSMLEESDTETLQQFLSTYQEIIVYLSKKDQGASYFLNQLARRICQQRKTPVLYLKLQKKINNEVELLTEIGVPSFQQLQKKLCYYSGIEIRKGKYQIQFKQTDGNHLKPYLIIDNFEYLIDALSSYSKPYQQQQQSQDDEEYPEKYQRYQYIGQQRLFDKIVSELVENCGINIIINTEHETAIHQLYSSWQQRPKTRPQKRGEDIYAFQFHRWQGLKQYDVYKIVSKAISNSEGQISKMLQNSKKQRYNFKELATILKHIKDSEVDAKTKVKFRDRGSTQDAEMKDYDLKLSVAKYYRLDKTYKILKNSQNRRFSFIKAHLDTEQLFRLEQLGLIQIIQGNILLK